MTDVLLFSALPDELRDAITEGVTRTWCPRCDGGRSREQSLSIRQADDDVVLTLHCYRASCGFYGVTVTDPNANLIQTKIKEPTVYREPILKIRRTNIGAMLEADYGLRHSHFQRHGWGVAGDMSTLILPIRSPFRLERGHITRTFDKPKRCYTYKATTQPWLDWWRGEGRDIVIVEDCLSACRLSQLGYRAVALLGTAMSTEQAKEIAEVARVSNFKDVILALDRDAFEKAIYMAKRNSHIIKMNVRCLEQDIKNMEHDRDIEALING